MFTWSWLYSWFACLFSQILTCQWQCSRKWLIATWSYSSVSCSETFTKEQANVCTETRAFGCEMSLVSFDAVLFLWFSNRCFRVSLALAYSKWWSLLNTFRGDHKCPRWGSKCKDVVFSAPLSSNKHIWSTILCMVGWEI